MSAPRRTRTHGASAVVALAGLVVLALGASTPAHAAKPADPPGRTSASTSTSTADPAAPGSAQGSAQSQPAAAPEHGKAAAAPGRAKATSPRDHSAGTAGTSGEATSPQPRSTADDNGTGANQSGPYDSTRDGTASQNGKGDDGGGKATGRPCAGCVGKADNKNPRGQRPGGSDHNAGYECDRNQGIGKGNPAHTTCKPGTENPPPGGDDCVAGNQYDDPATEAVECEASTVSPPEGGTVVTVVDPPLTVVDPPTAPAQAAAAVLPQTGLPAGLPWLLALGLALVCGGGLVTHRVRVRA